MKTIIIVAIRSYQRFLSPDKGYLGAIVPMNNVCTMYPSCSEYAVTAIEKYGVAKGVWMGLRRIGRCHPWQKKLVDTP